MLRSNVVSTTLRFKHTHQHAPGLEEGYMADTAGRS